MSELLGKLNISQAIEDIKTLFNYFNGNTILFFVLFLLSVEYIWFVEKNKKIRDFFTWYIVLILIIIWNPICIKILEKFINFGSMYRIYYLMPITLTIAVAGTRFIENIKNKFGKILVLLIFLGGIVFCGDCIFNETTTVKVNNNYKLPDETVAVAEIIHNDNTFKEKRAVVPYGMSSQINQIYPEIYLPYTRVISNPGTASGGNATPMDTDDASNYEPVVQFNNGNISYLKGYFEQKNINYIVASKSIVFSEPLENIKFEKYQETSEYIIYRKVVK